MCRRISTCADLNFDTMPEIEEDDEDWIFDEAKGQKFAQHFYVSHRLQYL